MAIPARRVVGGLSERSLSSRSRERRREAVPALDAVVEPLVQHDVTQPSIAECARQIRTNRFENGMTMPAGARLDLGESRIVIDANLQVWIRNRSARVVFE